MIIIIKIINIIDINIIVKSMGEANYPEESVRLPDGNMIVMGKESISAPEIMFKVQIDR